SRGRGRPAPLPRPDPRGPPRPRRPVRRCRPARGRAHPGASDPPRVTRSRSGLVLTPGASAGRDQPALVAIDDALAAEGWAVARVDFPYRRAGRRTPDREPVLVEAVRDAAAELASSARL